MPDDDRLGNLPMVGDVNIFLYGGNTGDSPPLAQTESEENENYAEVEVMIAGMLPLSYLSRIVIEFDPSSNRRTVIPA